MLAGQRPCAGGSVVRPASVLVLEAHCWPASVLVLEADGVWPALVIVDELVPKFYTSTSWLSLRRAYNLVPVYQAAELMVVVDVAQQFYHDWWPQLAGSRALRHTRKHVKGLLCSSAHHLLAEAVWPRPSPLQVLARHRKDYGVFRGLLAHHRHHSVAALYRAVLAEHLRVFQHSSSLLQVYNDGVR